MKSRRLRPRADALPRKPGQLVGTIVQFGVGREIGTKVEICLKMTSCLLHEAPESLTKLHSGARGNVRDGVRLLLTNLDRKDIIIISDFVPPILINARVKDRLTKYCHSKIIYPRCISILKDALAEI